MFDRESAETRGTILDDEGGEMVKPPHSMQGFR